MTLNNKLVGVINRETTKFCGSLAKIEAKNESGTIEQMKFLINQTENEEKDLNPSLSELILEALTRVDFKFCTSVQAATIHLRCSYKDVTVNVATGSSKTLAFVVPLMEILYRNKTPPKPN
nr:DEAD-box ATP-dependent RNA helicase 18-like [Quercus suber]